MSLDVAGRNAQVEGLTSRIAEVSLHDTDGAELSGGGYERQVPAWSQPRGGVQTADVLRWFVPARSSVAAIGYWTEAGERLGLRDIDKPERFDNGGEFSLTSLVEEVL